MVMQAMHSGKGSTVLKLTFFGILILAAAGLVLTDVGGFFRGGVSNGDVAKIGKDKITLVEFDRAARRAVSRIGLSPEQAYQLGYMNQVLNAEIQRSLFKQVADSRGIKISRQEVAQQIDAMIEPMVRDGMTKQDILDNVLRSQGFVESEFVRNVAAEAASGILSRGLQNQHLNKSEYLAKDLYAFQNETRTIEYITFLNSDMDDAEKPSEDQLLGLYEASKPRFVIPESRDITVSVLKMDALEETIEITEEQVRNIYDEDVETYKVPEQRFLKQAILENQETAIKVQKAADSGTDLKKAVKDATGDETAFIDEQAFEKNGLVEDISNIVFAESDAKSGTIYGPIESPLGWHVLELTKVNAPYTKTFESVKDNIRKELLADEMLDQQFDMIATVEDMLAAGSTIDEVNDVIPVERITIENVTSKGAMAQAKHPLDQFGEDQQTIADLTFEFFEGESSPVTELSDGRLVFVQVDKIIEQSFKPFEDVKADIEKAWMRDQKNLNNRNAVVEILNTAAVEGTTLKDVSTAQSKTLKTQKDLLRNSDLKEPLVSRSIRDIFEAAPNEIIMFDLANGYALGHVTAIDFAEPKDNDTSGIDTIKEELARTSANEALSVYFENQRQNYNVVVNNDVLERAYSGNNTQ